MLRSFKRPLFGRAVLPLATAIPALEALKIGAVFNGL
jgi:hypothetical protein